MGVNNGNNIFSQLESTDKQLSNSVFKFNIWHFYEAVVSGKVVQNSTSGVLQKIYQAKESQKTNLDLKIQKHEMCDVIGRIWAGEAFEFWIVSWI